MDGMSLKEKAVLGIIAMLALYAATVLLYFSTFQQSWTSARQAYENTQKTVARERRVIAEKDAWDEEYREEVLQIREIDEGRGADTFWIGIIQDIATRNHITITSQRANREEVADEMKRMTVDVEWIGALETLVKFLYELETTEEGKFDVTAINFNPYAKRPGFLSGKMTLACVYRRKTT